MEFTYDHGIYILGIFIGVGLTLVGIWFTEYLKNRYKKIKLTTAFRNEVLNNLNNAIFNLKLYEDPHEERKGARRVFYTSAYERLKLEMSLDWTKSKLASQIHDGFSFAEEYNKRIDKPKLLEKEMGNEKIILEQIQEKMLKIGNTLKNNTNLENVLRIEDGC